MEDDILDDFGEGKKKSMKHAKASFWYFTSMLVGFIILTILTALYSGSRILEISSMVLALFFFTFPIIGLVNGIKSVRKYEPSTWFKYTGLIGNLLFCLLLIGAIIMNVFDLVNQLN